MTFQAAGVRERRKVETRAALTAAAIQVLVEEGLEELTADRIAEVAGVSRRTLFNYFPRVEDVLTASLEAATVETIDAIVDRPADEPLRTSALVVLEAMIDGPVFAQARELERAAGRSTATRRFLLEFEDRQRAALEEGLRRRLGEDADPIYVASLAAASFGALCAVTRLAVSASSDEAHAAELHKVWIRRAMEHLFAGFDEAAAVPARPDRGN
ncbi:TetR/AcrR family transcriptional regulator [Nocardioides sp.]|uniref:TetR/AcrR family transcriptional regulator n=1 Tax=Nocardioides sp. TaxID=35761 RepID=UPI0035B49D20